MAADIQQYTKNMTDIMNSFNDSFPLVSKDLNPLEKSVLATVVAKVANDIKQAVNVDEVVGDSLDVFPSEMKSDIEAHAKSLGKSMSELTAGEIFGIIEVVAQEPKYGEWVNINNIPLTGGISDADIDTFVDQLFPNPGDDPFFAEQVTEIKDLLKDSKLTGQEKLNTLIQRGMDTKIANNLIEKTIGNVTTIESKSPSHTVQNKTQWYYATATSMYLEAHGLLPDDLKAKLRNGEKIPVTDNTGVRSGYLGYDSETETYYYDTNQAYIAGKTNESFSETAETNKPRPADQAITSSSDIAKGKYIPSNGVSSIVNEVSGLYSYPIILTVAKSEGSFNHAFYVTNGGVDDSGNSYLDVYDPMNGSNNRITDSTTEFTTVGNGSVIGFTTHESK